MITCLSRDECMTESCLRHRGILHSFPWPILGVSCLCSWLALVTLLGNPGSAAGIRAARNLPLPLTLGAVFKLQPLVCSRAMLQADLHLAASCLTSPPSALVLQRASWPGGGMLPMSGGYNEQGRSSRGQHTQCWGHLFSPQKCRKTLRRTFKSPSTWSHRPACTSQHNSWAEILRV